MEFWWHALFFTKISIRQATLKVILWSILHSRLGCSRDWAWKLWSVSTTSTFYDRLIYSSMCTKINTGLVVTNAAGGLNSDYNVGDITLLNDVRLSSFTENIPTSLIRSSIFSWRALQVFIR